MSLVYGVNEVSNVSDMLTVFSDNGINSITNLISKLNYSINSEITTTNILFNGYSSNAIEMVTDNIDTSLTYNLELLRLVPVKIRVNIVNDEVYLYVNKIVHIISITLYNSIISLSDTFITKIDTDISNSLTEDNDKCLNDECYFIQTTIYNLKDTGISINDILTLGIDYSSKLSYMHIDIPITYRETILSVITNIESYIVNKTTVNKSFISSEIIYDIFNKPIVEIKNNRVRDFVWTIRDMCKYNDVDNNDSDIVLCYNKILKKLSSEHSEIKTEEFIEDFPSLADLLDNNNTTVMIKLTIPFFKDKINIGTTDIPLLNNKLDVIRDKVNNI